MFKVSSLFMIFSQAAILPRTVIGIPFSSIASTIVGTRNFWTSGNNAFKLSSVALIELIMEWRPSLALRPASKTTGSAVSTQRGISVCFCISSTNHSIVLTSLSGCLPVPTFTSMKFAPAAACFSAKFLRKPSSFLSMASPTFGKVAFIFSPTTIMSVNGDWLMTSVLHIVKEYVDLNLVSLL